jgi:hypothetical protein
VIGGLTFNLVCVRVDGEGLVSPLPKAPINDIAPVVLGISGDPGDGPYVALPINVGNRNLAIVLAEPCMRITSNTLPLVPL